MAELVTARVEAVIDLSRLRPPGGVMDIARKLLDAGFETWCVGGAIRDALLGQPNTDWDLATAATPSEVQRLFRRTVPVGLDFGTVGVLDRDGTMHEVTTFRRDVETDGRHAVVQFGASLEDDLARRDFTVNAIAFHPVERRVFDPFGGLADLDAGVIRAVGDADARMHEDRLRALRAIRFAARFGFALDVATRDAVEHSAPHLHRLSPERVKGEIDKTIDQVVRPSAAFLLWRDLGAFATVAPALASVSDVTLHAVDCIPLPRYARRAQRHTLRVAVLMSEMPPSSAASTLKALRFSNSESAWIASLLDRSHIVGGKLAAIALDDSTSAQRDASLRRIASTVGRTRVGGLLRLSAARWSATAARGLAAPAPRAVRHLYKRMLRIAFHEPIELADLAVDGDDLREAGVAPGPRLGRMLHALMAIVLTDPRENTREALLAYARQLDV